MAKSEGNFRTIRDVLDEAPGEAARYAMLMSALPRSARLDRRSGSTQAKHTLDRFYLALRGAAASRRTAPNAARVSRRRSTTISTRRWR